MRRTLFLTIGTTIAAVALAHYEDPSPQELDFMEWTSGLRIAYCSDTAMPDLVSPFRRAMSKVATTFCQANLTACNLRRPVIFHPEQVVLLEGYPKREYGIMYIKFMIILPHNTIPLARFQRPLLSRETLSKILSTYLRELSDRLGWTIVSYERYPRFDSMTEFMNIAIIPIVLISIASMFGLAYWITAVKTRGGLLGLYNDALIVSGAGGGKSETLRRTMEIIAEQNEEIERQVRMELAKGAALLNGEGIRIQIDSINGNGNGHANGTRLIPSENVSTASQEVSTMTSVQMTGMSSPYGQHLTPAQAKGRRSSRRQSSVDDVKIRRQRRNASAGLQKTWKAGSLMLGGFASRNRAVPTGL